MKILHIKRESLENVHPRALLSIRWDDEGWEVMVNCPAPFSRKMRACDFGRSQKMTTLDAFARFMWGRIDGRLWTHRFIGLEVVEAESKRDCHTLYR